MRSATAGGEYKVYKNTLVRFAARDLGLEIDDLLTGPTAIAFVPGRRRASRVAKALQDFAKTNPALVVKGGLLGDQVLDAAEVKALADRPREVLLAKFAGLLAAPMQQFAGLLEALPRELRVRPQGPHRPGGAPGAPADAPAPVVEEAPAAEPEAEAEHPPRPLRGSRSPRRRNRNRHRCRADESADTDTGELTMATKEEILDSIANMTVLELSELLKAFEEKFGVTAAAPAAVAVAAGRRWWRRGDAAEEQDEFDVVLDRRRREEDQRHQGGACPHQPRSQGGQGPGGRRPQARPREGFEGRRREGQGAARSRRRHRRTQVAPGGSARSPVPPNGRCLRAAAVCVLLRGIVSTWRDGRHLDNGPGLGPAHHPAIHFCVRYTQEGVHSCVWYPQTCVVFPEWPPR